MIQSNRSRSHRNLATTAVAWAAAAIAVGWMGCAKIESASGGGGRGANSGSGGSPVQLPTIPGLVEIRVTLNPATINLTDNNGSVMGTSMATAEGRTDDGQMLDITTRVAWTVNVFNANVVAGAVTVLGPGRYTITARNGGITGSAELVAQYAGDRFGPTFPPADKAKLDGTPAGQTASIAYPLDGAIFPSNLGPIAMQVSRSGGQDIARIAFVGDGVDLKYYARCEADATRHPGTGCTVLLPLSLTTLMIAPSTKRDIQVTARLASSAGSGLVESNAVNLAWSNVPLQGGLYYWTVIRTGSLPGYSSPNNKPDGTIDVGTAVSRYDFDNTSAQETVPRIIYTDQGLQQDTDNDPTTAAVFGILGPNGQIINGSPPAAPNLPRWGEGRCIGCHALSFDGKLLAFSIGGSAPSSFGLLNLETKALMELDPAAAPATATGIDYLKRFRRGNFAALTTFGPGSDLMVNMYRGALTLHQVNATLTAVRPLFTGVTERKSDPFWSPDGRHFAFSSYDIATETQAVTASRGAVAAVDAENGDTKSGGQIWLATANATGPNDDAQVLIPRESGVTSYYPAISADGALLAFNKSSCSGPMNPGGYGIAPCDGYDDITASLWLTSPTGRMPAKLTRANGNDMNGNSWPRWSPNKGTFREQELYWLAFSSRRNYGSQVNTLGPAAAVPQIWFAAVVVGGEFSSGDVSYSPVWLPGQNLNQSLPTGNHVPQWVRVAVAID